VEQVDVEPRQTGFEAVARELIEPLRRYLARRTDAATADDVLSETLLVAWRRRAEMPAEPLAWAYAVARNCLANADRTRRRQDRLLVRIWQLARPPEHAPARDDPDPALARALARLSSADAELVRLLNSAGLPLSSVRIWSPVIRVIHCPDRVADRVVSAVVAAAGVAPASAVASARPTTAMGRFRFNGGLS
jgi:RNA polymerase sigma-70 factor (ECF subfamily)